MTAEIAKQNNDFPQYWQYQSSPHIQDPERQDVLLDRQKMVQDLGTKAASSVVAENDSRLAFQAYPAPAIEDVAVKSPDPRGSTVVVRGRRVRTTPLELPAAGQNRVHTEIQFEKAHTTAHELFDGLGIQVPSKEDLSEFFDLSDLKRHFQNELEEGRDPLVFLYSPDIKLGTFRRIIKREAEDQPRMPNKITGMRKLGVPGKGWSDRRLNKYYVDQDSDKRWGIGVVNRQFEKFKGKTSEQGQLGVAAYLTAQLNLIHKKEEPLDERGCTILDGYHQKIRYGHNAFLGRWNANSDRLDFFDGYVGSGFDVFVGLTVEGESYKYIQRCGGEHYRKFKSAETIDSLIL